ncbi:MAG TPA: hypothetical protein VFZ34_03875 [Blastocatellia bacterium]|nr:hypothetical protein [Blastocatellia bacterium]
MTVRKLYFALIVVVIAAISVSILRAQSPEQDSAQAESVNGHCGWLCQQRERQAQRLEGSWEMIVTPVPPPGAPPLPTRHLYVSFARGGVYTGFDRSAPFGSPQHGVWEYRGGNRFAWAFSGDNFDPLGNFVGTLKLNAKITMTGKDTFIGVANPQVRDAAGNLLLDACSTFRAERIKAEPLSERCQSITPPQ